MILEITPKTTIHTGGIAGFEKLKLTGLIGSIRWWMEAVVRGLDGYACSPTAEKKCDFDSRKLSKLLEQDIGYHQAMEIMMKDICPVCQIFGCTGFSSAFKWTHNDNNLYRINLIPLRQIDSKLVWLFDSTLRIISNYGSIGGKNPSKNSSEGIANLQLVDYSVNTNYDQVVKWLKILSKEKNNNFYPNLKFFWFTARHYSKTEINSFLKLNPNGYPQNVEDEKLYEFLRGKRGVSKKIFSFKYKENNQELSRTWGYLRAINDFKKVDLLGDIIYFENIKEQLKERGDQ